MRHALTSSSSVWEARRFQRSSKSFNGTSSSHSSSPGRGHIGRPALAHDLGGGGVRFTNQRQGALSGNPYGPRSESRLVGGFRAPPQPEVDHRGDSAQKRSTAKWLSFLRPKRPSTRGAVKEEEASGLYGRTWNAAPTRPSWWRWRGVTSSERGGAGDTNAPLNPLHRPAKFSFISLIGGAPPTYHTHTSKKTETETEFPSSYTSAYPSSPNSSRRSDPLHKKSDTSPYTQDMTSRSTSRFMQAARALHGKSRGERAAFTALLSDEQKLEIVNREIESKWWAKFWYKPFRSITDQRLRSTKRVLHVLLLLCSLTSFGACVYLYREEMRILASLTPEDRSDYISLVSQMRFSDLWRMGMEVLNKEDPLEALPADARYHLVLEAARRLGWLTTVDWTLEMRRKHPHGPLEEGDYLHILYWTMIYVGSMASGGSSLFSMRLLGEEDPAKATAPTATKKKLQQQQRRDTEMVDVQAPLSP